jgi:hypothetical protein
LNIARAISDAIDMMIKDYNLDISKEDIRELKEKALREWCAKNNVCYIRGSF